MPRNQICLPRPTTGHGRRVLATASALVLALTATAPSFAEDQADPNAAVIAATEKTKAETDKIKAETEKVKAQMDALGLTPAKGETTLGENAGAMEAYMLSAAAMNEAARSIAAEATGKVILVGGQETLDLSLPVMLQTQMDRVTKEAVALAEGACPTKPSPPGGKGVVESAATALPAIGAVISALKVDTEISGIKIETPPSDRAFVNAVASHLSDGIVLSEAVWPADFDRSRVGTAWRDLRDARAGLVNCHAKLVLGKKTELAAKVEASIGAVDTFSTAISKSETGGSAIARAAILEKALPAGVRVLRVSSEYAGGSLIKRTSLWTALGYPAVSLTGGLVASYRLTDPTTGRVYKSGLLICRTAQARLTQVQNGKVGVGDCTPALKTGAQ